jgi:predicted NBD/HSP70 family sugar kinase
MAKAIGVVMTDRIVAGLVDGNQIMGELLLFPPDPEAKDGLVEIPSAQLSRQISDIIADLAGEATDLVAVGVAVPGIVRNGVIEDSPNLSQMKGAKLRSNLDTALRSRGIDAPVCIFNDADAVATGLAATKGHLDRLVHVWTIGNGIGFGRYPTPEGPWEGGHMVVSLDPKENYCGCGGRGHLEGITGYRAMRRRFLDLEPEEIFEAAKKGDPRCSEFVHLWHRALAAATATAIHLEGVGRFFFTGRNIQFLEETLLKGYLDEMVMMSPLQSYTIEVLPEDGKTSIIGAATAAALTQTTTAVLKENGRL